MNNSLIHLDESEWNRRTRGFLDHNYRQMWSYGTHAADRIGAKAERVALIRADVCVGLADVRIKALPVVGGGVAYINGGPLVRGRDAEVADHSQRLTDMLSALAAEYVERRGMVLRIVGTLGDEAWIERQKNVLSELGFEQTDVGAKYRTFVVRIDEKLETLRGRLAQKWRNCLNSSERQGVSVQVFQDVESLDRFRQLYETFAERKGLEVNHDAAFFLKVQEGLEGDDRLTVQLATREGELVAGHVSSMAGDTCVYLLGATAPAGLTSKAAYLLQWNTIRLAHERGLTWYDLGGIDPELNPGVHHFKKGMSGVDVVAPGPFEATPRGIRGRVTLSTERLYRRLRGRRTTAIAPPPCKGATTESGQEKSE